LNRRLWLLLVQVTLTLGLYAGQGVYSRQFLFKVLR